MFLCDKIHKKGDDFMKCPNCGTNSVQYRGTGFYLFLGILISGFGLLLSLFLIGIPILIFGLIIIAFAFFGEHHYKCNNCGNTWKKEEQNKEIEASE